MNLVKIFHNPACGTSRNVLGLIRHAGIEPEVVEYLRTPPTREELTWLLAEAGLSVRQVLRDKGHSPSEAFNETVEELTQSLMPLVAENGMDWMYANCSTTAQRGALDWWKKFRDATAPVFKELYESVAAGKESQRSIDSNSKPDYREKLEEELKELRESEMWQAGKTVRSLRPENQK